MGTDDRPAPPHRQRLGRTGELIHNDGMRYPMLARLTLAALLAPALCAWSPAFHEAQTRLAVKMLPRPMAAHLADHEQDLLQGARGQGNDQVPTVEDIEAQFRLILEISEQGCRPGRLARELGTLGHQVQLLMDPSAVFGASPLRESFEAYGDQQRHKLVITREPFWAVSGPLDPRPRLLQFAKTKYDRLQALGACFDDATSRRVGPWDDLSVPFAQLQLSYSGGVHATANLWILLWRAAGDLWLEPQE
jgi:hypothetical protein